MASQLQSPTTAHQQCLQLTPPLTYDAIYYASIPVFFTPVPRETFPFIASEWHEDASSLPAALSRFSLIPDPDGGLPLFHPAIPALDLLRKSDASSESARAAATQALPLLLHQPLLKVPESLSPPPPNAIQGYASGVRSALLKLDGQWSASSCCVSDQQLHFYILSCQINSLRAFLRFCLKGCGNNSDGFIVRNERQNIAVDDAAPQMLEFGQVRVAAFSHTAARELVMSGRVADALAPLDAAGANTPVACMTYNGRHVHANQPIAPPTHAVSCRYTSLAQLPLGPSVPVACIVERTLE